jgi:rod shape-determining protein MreC
MQRQNFLPFFLVFFGISLALFLLGSSGIFTDITSIFNRALSPGRSMANVLTLKSLQNKTIKSLSEENQKLKRELADEENIIDENNALKNQFDQSQEKSQNLLPAKVIGMPGFVPGVSLPEYLIIDKGENAGIKNGDTIISNNFLVGKVEKVYPDISRIELVTSKKSSFTAKVGNEEEANGIIKGQGADVMILDNVLLTTNLKKDAQVLTKGDKNEKNEGYPPDLIVGKIFTIEKKQSELFQRARIVSPIDFKNLETVFVLR